LLKTLLICASKSDDFKLKVLGCGKKTRLHLIHFVFFNTLQIADLNILFILFLLVARVLFFLFTIIVIFRCNHEKYFKIKKGILKTLPLIITFLIS